MHNLLYNISQVLGITILHSLWQGLIIFILLRLFLLARPSTSSAIKYRASYAALCIMLGWFVVTLFNESGHYQWLSTTALQVAPLTLPFIIHEVNAPVNKLYFTIAQYMPYLTMLYAIGLVYNTLKLSMAWNNIYRIRQNSNKAGFDDIIGRLSHQLNIKKFVKVACSEWVNVPCITGFIKPVILLPVSIISNLSAQEIEVILLHELAHVKRNDYLLNLIQQVIGILLFFNPFARLAAKIINQERENCCDDMVVRVADSPFIYAQALLKLEENKQYQWQLALAATTKKYELLNRIERIMKTKTQTVNIRPVLITLLALTCAISSIAWLNPEIKDGKIVIKNAPAIRKVTAMLSAPAPAVTEPVALVQKPQKTTVLAPVADTNRATTVNDTTLKNKTATADQEKWKQQIADAQKYRAELQEAMNTPQNEKIAEIQQAIAKKQLEPGKKQQEEQLDQIKEWIKTAKTPEARKMFETILEKAEATKHRMDSLTNLYIDPVRYLNSPENRKRLEETTDPKRRESIIQMANLYNSPDFKEKLKKVKENANSNKKYYDEILNSPDPEKTYLRKMDSVRALKATRDTARDIGGKN